MVTTSSNATATGLDCACRCGNPMVVEKLDAWRGWLNIRFCHRCRSAIKRSKKRFHCSRCEVDVCVDCVTSSRTNARRPRESGRKLGGLLGNSITPLSSNRQFDQRQRVATPVRQGLATSPRQRSTSPEQRIQRWQPNPRRPVQPNEHPEADGLRSELDTTETWLPQPLDGFDQRSRRGRSTSPARRIQQNDFSRQARSVPPPSLRSRARGGLGMMEPSRQHPPTDTFPLGQFGNGCSLPVPVSAAAIPADTLQMSSAASILPCKKSSFRQRSLKGTSLRVSIVPTVEFMFLDEDEYVSELCRFSVPARGDGLSNKDRTPDTVHCSWCPCGLSCAEHGGRTWSGHMGCPYSIHIPTPLASACSSVRCESPFHHPSCTDDFRDMQSLAPFPVGQQWPMQPQPQQAPVHTPLPPCRSPPLSSWPQTPRTMQQSPQTNSLFLPQGQRLSVF